MLTVLFNIDIFILLLLGLFICISGFIFVLKVTLEELIGIDITIKLHPFKISYKDKED